jgi:hypothetical protein
MGANRLFLPINVIFMQEDYIIGAIAVGGGLAIGAISIIVSVPWAMKEKLTKLEARNRERMALIEKGIDPDQMLKEKRGVGHDPLFWGLLLTGLGLGILLGYIVSMVTQWDSMILPNAMGTLLGGLGMIVYTYRKRADDQRPS